MVYNYGYTKHIFDVKMKSYDDSSTIRWEIVAKSYQFDVAAN